MRIDLFGVSMAREHRKLIEGGTGRTFHMIEEQRYNNPTYGRQFVVMFPDAMMDLAVDRKASSAAIPVLLWMTKNIGHERFKMLTQPAVGEALGFAPTTIGKALADLLDRGYVEKRGGGPRQEWRVSLKSSWMGTAAAYQKAKRTRLQLVSSTEGAEGSRGHRR
jgi:hypothetical protein